MSGWGKLRERERRDSDAHIATWNGKMKGKCKMRDGIRKKLRGEWVNPALGLEEWKREKRSISIKELLEGLAGGPAFYIYSYIYITKLFAIESRRNRGSQFAQRVIYQHLHWQIGVAAAALFYFVFILFIFTLVWIRIDESSRKKIWPAAIYTS